MDAATLAAVMGNTVSLARYEALCPAWNELLVRAECNTVQRVAMICAQVGTESGGLKWMQEIWGPTAAQKTYEGRASLGNTQPGDGSKFRGHGPLQITGRANHTAVSKWAFEHGYVPTPTYFVDQPDELAGDRYGFVGVLWYWTVARPMNTYADRGDIVGATKAVNGGTNGLADRTARYKRALTFGDRLLPDGGADMAWRMARSLDVLLAQLNQLAPRRSKAADGGIGDAAHATRSSDHNPWYGPGIVTARDFTHDPAGGLAGQTLADALVNSRDPRIKYVIWNRRIIDSRPGNNPWQWMPYSGANAHTHHVHLSVMDNPSCDDTRPWVLPGLTDGGDELSAQYEQESRQRWPREDQLEKDLRGDLANKQRQLDQLTADMAEVKQALRLSGLAAGAGGPSSDLDQLADKVAERIRAKLG